jgi:hypothetical protein
MPPTEPDAELARAPGIMQDCIRMDDILSNPSPVVFFSVAFFAALLGTLILGILYRAMTRLRPSSSNPSAHSDSTGSPLATETSGPALLNNLQAAVTSLLAQDPGSSGQNQQIHQVRTLLQECSVRYPSAKPKIHNWMEKLSRASSDPGALMVSLSEIHAWTRQLLRGLG